MPALLLAAALAAVPADRPNVLLIVSDDQAWDDYGFLGSPHARTPHIDRLAARSLAFPRGYVPTSLCRPSLASILTGRLPHEHGVTGNDPAVPPGYGGPNRTWQKRTPAYLALRRALNRELADDPVLPALLRAAGYRTLQTGKWWEGDPRDFGFTAAMTHGDPSRGGRHGDAGLTIARDGNDPPDLGPIPDFLDAAGAAGEPWFVWYAPFLPHTPHDPPGRLRSRYAPLVETGELTDAEAKYFANVERWDEAVGAVLGEVDRRGLTGETLVVYVCDNGWITDPAGRYTPRSKRSPHEGGVRTPILLSRPGVVEPRTDETPVGSVDLPRTILTACGAPIPAAVGGVDLSDPAAVAGRGPVFGEIFAHDQPFPAPVAAGLTWRFVVDGRWKLIVPFPPNLPDGAAELYDLANDPHETRDLAAENPAEVSRLTKLLAARWNPTA